MKKKLLTNGKAFKRTDNRWGGTVWYMNEKGERKRKSFSGTTKAEVTKKMTPTLLSSTSGSLSRKKQARRWKTA